MDSLTLDDVDRGILHMLQQDARNHSPAAIAEEVDVAPNTVRNRIERLEEHGVIEGYNPHINYERAGFQLHVLFVCTVPVSDRHALAEQALEIEGVVRVIEALSGSENLILEAVGEDSDDITGIATQLEDVGCTIRDEQFLKEMHVQPFDHFGEEVV
ncbi:Lrp/AsnC family transcriptional regulator [Natronobacterium texcoconense]|uniref:DNA-binding transcriptional regulator, Lrp family n=1 Tax=Natronobacterium texcoconense TaxID=1095778 RepID=A0A1H1IYF9_NATTX|nr:Lrp/AsnC family transcriptional regulator [Natronobacterium texcoconense]SDR42751.1 DNA-binding transcriptional regulator, Lrp family [Natronobacterium texcoconense]